MRGQVPHGGIGVGTLCGFTRLKPYFPQCKQQQQIQITQLRVIPPIRSPVMYMEQHIQIAGVILLFPARNLHSFKITTLMWLAVTAILVLLNEKGYAGT